jgi:hypothetical protein
MAYRPPKPCSCGSGLLWRELVDAQGIFCTFVCDKCEDERRSHFRPEIFTGYTQADVDEPIEEEGY